MSFDKLLKNLRDDDGGTKIDIDEIGRHRDGLKQTLSEIVDVEYGSNSNGFYEKFPDGRLRCYHVADMGPRNAVGTGSSNNVYRTTQYDWTYPGEYIETPVIAMHVSVDSENANDRASSVVSHKINRSYTRFQVFFMSSTDGSSLSKVTLIAEGRWRE